MRLSPIKQTDVRMTLGEWLNDHSPNYITIVGYWGAKRDFTGWESHRHFYLSVPQKKRKKGGIYYEGIEDFFKKGFPYKNFRNLKGVCNCINNWECLEPEKVDKKIQALTIVKI